MINDSICSLIENNCRIDFNNNLLKPPLPSCFNENVDYSITILGSKYSPNTTSISLNGDGSTIPSNIEFLSDLESLELGGNFIGSIPVWIGNLTNLKSLTINGTSITGAIPSELGNLSNLEYLFLSDNPLNGEIPNELGNLSNLQSLFISGTNITGAIPQEFGNLSKLNYLSISNNSIIGEIPIELGMLYQLFSLNLSNNFIRYNTCYTWEFISRVEFRLK